MRLGGWWLCAEDGGGDGVVEGDGDGTGEGEGEGEEDSAFSSRAAGSVDLSSADGCSTMAGTVTAAAAAGEELLPRIQERMSKSWDLGR